MDILSKMVLINFKAKDKSFQFYGMSEKKPAKEYLQSAITTYCYEHKLAPALLSDVKISPVKPSGVISNGSVPYIYIGYEFDVLNEGKLSWEEFLIEILNTEGAVHMGTSQPRQVRTTSGKDISISSESRVLEFLNTHCVTKVVSIEPVEGDNGETDFEAYVVSKAEPDVDSLIDGLADYVEVCLEDIDFGEIIGNFNLLQVSPKDYPEMIKHSKPSVYVGTLVNLVNSAYSDWADFIENTAPCDV